MDTPFLGIRNVSKSFPGVTALEDVSLSVERGEIHALVGENGAGKSTLVNILAGLLVPDSGGVFKNGAPLPFGDPMLMLRNGIGMVPQELTLVPHLSVAENIFLGSLPTRFGTPAIDWGRAVEKARDILGRIDPEIDPRLKLGDLGMARQQLVQIARAMAFSVDVLIFDEPTSALTYRETDRLFELIHSFCDAGGAVFYISHRMEEIKRLCLTVTILRDGRLIKTDCVTNLETAQIIELMVGRETKKSGRPAVADSAGAPAALRVESLTRVGEFEDISFYLHKGEILGFAGLMGAGRTELMKCVAGDTAPDSGTIRVAAAAAPVHFGHPAAAIAGGIAYMPEERRNYGIFPVMNVAENMTIASLRAFTRHWSIDRKSEAERVEEMIGNLRIKTPSWRQAIRNLSGGNQQKVILARWLLRGCAILILDEPTRGIDVKAKREIYELLWRIRRGENASIIIVSSELQELMDVCDRIVVMHEGRLKGEIVPREGITQNDIMRVALS
ncbi:MAG: sugar ABC transporter ATP-binding protein [Planctomycetota bacterium]|jgi:ABC-type sugar transport system ATPase subunit|nr:sugar ABC transporter ATP-binding protein [Planctomycetota bacterium]